MPDNHLPDDFNLFKYSDKIGGHLYKGTEKVGNRVGKNLGSAGIRFDSDDDRATELFKRFYGSELVKGHGNALIVPEIRVYLPYQELYHNLVVGYGEFSGGGGFQRFCDGKTIKMRRVKKEVRGGDGKPRPSWPVEQVREPCPSAADSSPCGDCTHIRRLTVYIAELYDHGYQRVFVMNMPAVNEIGLFHHLEQEERRLQRFAPAANVSNLPCDYVSSPETDHYIRWILTRAPEMIGVPGMKKEGKDFVFTGKQTQKEEWLMHLSIDPAWWTTAMSRIGKGQYRLDRDRDQVVCVEDERLRYITQMAKAAQMLAQAGQAATPFLMPGAPRPVLPPTYVDAEIVDYGPGIDLSGDRAVSVEVAEILDIDDAPFKPDTNDPTNSNRLMAIASLLPVTTTDDIKAAIAHHYEGRKSSELAEVHMAKVIDELLVMWAVQQQHGNGEPVFLNLEEADICLELHRDRRPTDDAAKVEWWKNLVSQRIESNGTTP